ncbi:MAG: hypothetical protein J2P57_08125 [Acidimicrobiaceae bacterium]|nr:hypothetical protein [Acidimicrobiaceae bacterium]
MRELRHEFHQQLVAANEKVIELFGLIPADLNLATDGLLNGNAEVLKVVNEREEAIDSIYVELERFANEQLALQGPVADDLRLLLSVLRVVPEIERSHDLVVLIAEHATHSLHESMSKRTRGLVVQMCATAVEMWQAVAVAWKERDPAVPYEIDDRNHVMDGLHATLMAELASGTMPLAVTMDMTLVARFYERLGAHAVNVARRVVFLSGREDG